MPTEDEDGMDMQEVRVEQYGLVLTPFDLRIRLDSIHARIATRVLAYSLVAARQDQVARDILEMVGRAG